MESETYRSVREAIIKKQQVVATYHNQRREMCPHVIGWKNGREKALFYQFAGGSNSGLSGDARANWRGIFIDELEVLEVRNGPWRTGPNHSRPQRNVDEIDVEVDFDDSDDSIAA